MRRFHLKPLFGSGGGSPAHSLPPTNPEPAQPKQLLLAFLVLNLQKNAAEDFEEDN